MMPISAYGKLVQLPYPDINGLKKGPAVTACPLTEALDWCPAIRTVGPDRFRDVRPELHIVKNIDQLEIVSILCFLAITTVYYITVLLDIMKIFNRSLKCYRTGALIFPVRVDSGAVNADICVKLTLIHRSKRVNPARYFLFERIRCGKIALFSSQTPAWQRLCHRRNPSVWHQVRI